MIAFSGVDLPAPLRPIRHRTSPGATARLSAAQDADLAVAGVEASTASVMAEVGGLDGGVGADLRRRAGGEARGRSRAR